MVGVANPSYSCKSRHLVCSGGRAARNSNDIAADTAATTEDDREEIQKVSL